MSFSDIEFKASSGTFNVDQAQGIVECFVAGVGNKDSVGDVLLPGAFNSSLKRRKPRVVWGHNWNDPIGKVLEIYEVPPTDPRLPGKMKAAGIGGLYARVQFNLNSEKGREAFANVAFFGEEQEWSIGYKTIQASFDPNLQANILREVELYEVSPVLHGANQLTGTISVKSDTALAEEEKGHGMMGMPGMPHSPGMPSGMMKPMAPKPQQAVRPVRPSVPENPLMVALRRELVKRSGSNVIVRSATENTVIFDRLTSDGESSTYRVAFHFQDGQFMFGKPQRVQSQTVYTPEIPAIPSSPAQAFAVSMKPQGDAYLGDDPDDFMPMPGKSDDLDFDDFFLDDIEEKIGRSLNKRNLAKLKNVMEMLQEVLASAEKEVEVKSAEYVIPVDINNAFHTKQLLDPIMDYHRVDSYVSEKGIVITSGVTPEFIDAVETLKKGLGNRIGRAIGGGGGGKGRRLARGLTARFDPNAWDGDGDGIVQEGTPFQRPAIPGVNDRSTRGRVNTQAAIQAAQGQGINTGRGLRSSGGKESNDDASILRRREAGETLQDVAESLGMRREDVRKAELRAIRQRDAKRKQNDEILKRREAGESLQDVAQSLNMRREDVRQAELEAKKRRDGGLRSGTQNPRERAKAVDSAVEAMSKLSPSERREAFRNIVKDQLELFDATGDDEIDFYKEYLSELMSDFLTAEAPSGDYVASEILDGSDVIDKESVSDLLNEVQDVYEKLGGKGRFGDMYKTRGKREVSEDDQIASLLALGTVLDSLNNRRVRRTDKENSDSLRNMVRGMQSAGDSKGRRDGGLRSRTAKANSVEQRKIIDEMGDRFAEMTIDEQTRALQQAIEALDASLGNDGDTSMDDVDDILLESLGEVLSRFMPKEQGDFSPAEPGSDWDVASAMEGEIPDEAPGQEELSDLISTLKDQYVKLSDGDRDDFTKFFTSRRRPKSPLSEDDKNNARLALIATLSSYGKDRGGPFEDIQQLADSIDAGGSRRGLRSSTDKDDVDALLDEMQVEIDRDRAIVDARLAGKSLDDVAEEYGMSREEVRKLEIQEIKKRARDLIPARTPAELAERREPGQEPRFQDTDRALAEFILRKRFEGTPVRELAGILGVRAEDLRAWEIAETRGDPRMNRARGLRSSSMNAPLSITDRRGRRISEFLRDIQDALDDYPTAYSTRGGLDKDWVDGLIRDMKNGTTNFEDMNRVLKLAVDDMNMERAKPSPDEARLARQLEVAKTARRVIVDGVSKEELENLNPARRRRGMRSTTENLGKRGSGMVKRDEKGKIDPTESREARQKIESDIVDKLRELGFTEDEINTLTNGLNNKFPTTGVRSSTGRRSISDSKKWPSVMKHMEPGEEGGGWDEQTKERATQLFESIVLSDGLSDMTQDSLSDELALIREEIVDIALAGVDNTGEGGPAYAVAGIAYLARDLVDERIEQADILNDSEKNNLKKRTASWLESMEDRIEKAGTAIGQNPTPRDRARIAAMSLLRAGDSNPRQSYKRGVRSSTGDVEVVDMADVRAGRASAAAQQARQARLDASKELRDIKRFMESGQQGGGWDAATADRAMELFESIVLTDVTPENIGDELNRIRQSIIDIAANGVRNTGDGGNRMAVTDIAYLARDLLEERVKAANIPDDEALPDLNIQRLVSGFTRNWDSFSKDEIIDLLDDWRDRMERNINKLPIGPNPNAREKARIRGLMSSTRDGRDRVSDARERVLKQPMIRDLDESSISRAVELFDAAAKTPFTRENMRSRMDALAEDAVRLMSDGLFGEEGEEAAFIDVLRGVGEVLAEQIASAMGIDDFFPAQNQSIWEIIDPWGNEIAERVFDAWDDKGIGDSARRARLFKDWTGRDRAVSSVPARKKTRTSGKANLEKRNIEKREDRILRRREQGETLQEVAESLGMRREDVRKAELRAMRRRDERNQSRNDSDEGMRSSTRRVANSLSMTLSDDEIAQLRDEIPMLKRSSANGSALDALDEKLKNARNGKVDLTPDEVEQIEDAIESAKESSRDGKNPVVTSDIQGVIDQAAESEGGKYVSLNWEDQQAGKRGNLGLRSNNNNGAPVDIDEARQKKLVFFMNSARGGSLGVSMRIREEYNRRGDGTLLAKDWKALDTLYSNITGDVNPKKASGRGMRSSTSDDDTGGGGIRVTGLGDAARARGSKGRPMGSRGKEDSKGKTFQSMKPDNWDDMTAEQQFNWMADHSPERSGMRKVDYDRVMKEVLDREASDERRAEREARRAERGPVQPAQRQPQQGPKEVAVKPRPANDADATTERRDDSRRINNFLDKTVNDASRLSDRGRIDELHAEAWDEIADIMDSEDLSRNQIKAAIQRVKNYLADAEEADDTDGPAEKIIQRAETLLRTLNGLDTYYKNDKFIKDGPEIEVAPRRGRAAADIADISDDAFDDTGGVVRRVEGRPLDIDDNVPTPEAQPEAGEVITRRMGEGLRSSVPVNANRVVSQEVRDYVAARSRNTRGLRSSTDSKQGRTEIKAEATFFKDILDSLPKEIREADKAQDKRTSDALKALQDLINRQEAAKLGSRRTNAGRILMTRDEVDEILDAMMVVIDRQGAIGGNERQQKFATMLDMLAKAAMATFIDRTVEELGSRTVTRRNQRGREVEIQDL